MAENEILFRDLNENIEEAAALQGVDQHVFEFLCECANRDCTLRLKLNLSAYEQVRRNPDQFLVAPGHDFPEIENVVFRASTYQVVQKHGAAARLAEREDPRG